MFKIRTMNTISHLGTDILVKHGCEVGTEFETPDALLIRSADLHQTEFWPELKCIGRAGAGTNNIPLDRCSESGIVVFNAPARTRTRRRRWSSSSCSRPRGTSLGASSG